MATIPSLPTIDVYFAFNPTYSGTTLVESTTQALPASGRFKRLLDECLAVRQGLRHAVR